MPGQGLDARAVCSGVLGCARLSRAMPSEEGHKQKTWMVHSLCFALPFGNNLAKHLRANENAALHIGQKRASGTDWIMPGTTAHFVEMLVACFFHLLSSYSLYSRCTDLADPLLAPIERIVACANRTDLLITFTRCLDLPLKILNFPGCEK